MKIPVFCLDADDDMGSQAIGTAADRSVTEANFLANIQVALDRLIEDGDGSQITFVLTRHDMTDEELEALPEE